VWNTDTNGNYLGSPTGLVSASDPALENIEVSFKQDLNGDGTVGLPPPEVLESSVVTARDTGVTSLGKAGNDYAMFPTAGGAATILKYNGAAVTAGQFGATVNPIGAEAISGGYEVAWKVSGLTAATDQYIVWNTDATGNYLGSPTGVVAGSSFALEDLEPSFHQDLNGDGRASAQLITTTGTGNTVDLTGQSQATTINLGPNTAAASVGLSAPSLTFIGTPDAVTFGSGASIVEYAPQPFSGIETIANFVLGQDLLNIDLLGAATGTLQAYDTTVGGVHAIAFASSTDLTHGIVLLDITAGGETAANLLGSHTILSGGHALIS
jgi:serralysin